MTNLNAFEPLFRNFIQREMTTDDAHDLSHVERVVNTATALCEAERAEPFIVLPAAWLHDCFSYPKNHTARHKSSQIAADKAVDFLREIDYPTEYLDAIHHAIVAHSFSANVTPKTPEAKIVQDADRLDSLGAIGIARTMMVSATFNAAFYHADDPFCEHREPDDKAFTIDHFYAKLFKLVEQLNTPAAKREGERRTQFMRDFLAQLRSEI